MVGRLAVMGRSWRGALRNAEGARGAFCRTESNGSMLFDYVRRQTIRRRLQAVKKPLERPLPLLDKVETESYSVSVLNPLGTVRPPPSHHPRPCHATSAASAAFRCSPCSPSPS